MTNFKGKHRNQFTKVVIKPNQRVITQGVTHTRKQVEQYRVMCTVLWEMNAFYHQHK